jgi:NADPH:quinone reductase-like Zn-dependent oxidoreductase
LSDPQFSFAVQFALAAGAQVVALTSSAEKVQKLKELGTTHVINYNEVKEWEKKVQEIVSGLCRDPAVALGLKTVHRHRDAVSTTSSKLVVLQL